MTGFVYILRSTKTNARYVGSTNDPEHRLNQHNRDEIAATRGKGPWEILKLVKFLDESFAHKAEYHVKRQKNRRTIDLILSDQYKWPESLTLLPS